MNDSTTTEPAEFPKMLYRGGSPYGEGGALVPHQDTIVVNDAEEEAAAIADGYDAAEVFPEPVPEAPEPDLTEFHPEGGDDTLSGSEAPPADDPSGDDSLGGESTDDAGAGADVVEGAAGSDVVEGSADAGQ